jgi:Co/Zn/Cd efflux system component
LGTGSRWPDLAVATGMAGLALHSSWLVWRQARNELAHPEQAADQDHHGHSH